MTVVSTPRVGTDGGGQPPPVRQRAALDCREDALEWPGLDVVIDRGGDVAEVQHAHRVISAASDRHTLVTFSYVVQRESRPL
jgi:hypothetical protein